MKKILIIYPSMMVGGSTTSLLSILNELDYKRYEIDLLLLSQPGKLYNMIPSYINVLPYAMQVKNKREFKLKKFMSPLSIWGLLRGKYYDRKSGNNNIRSQIMQNDTVRFCKKNNKFYDVAISFLEGWPLYYLEKAVNAKRKIAWIHLDYIEAGLKTELDKPSLDKMNSIVLVSEKCKQSFDISFPELSNRSIVVENILSQSIIKKRAEEKISFALPKVEMKKLKFVSVCRIVFQHKGLDRGVRALGRLKKEGVIPHDFAWYIIGDGPDIEKLEKMILSNSLEDYVYICGEHINPLPLEKQCDVFFLPSRYEGKPMAVTEAQMLGLLPIVTEYSSAEEQIRNTYDGFIIPNKDEEIYRFLKKVFTGYIDIAGAKRNVSKRNYSNDKTMKEIYKLIEG